LAIDESRVRMGDLLVQTGVVTREAVEDAAATKDGQRLGALLVERGLVGEREVTRALSEQLHVPVVDLRDVRPEEIATALLDPADAHRYDMLPLLFIDGALTVAVADPLDAGLLAVLRSLPVDEVRLALGPPTCCVIASTRRIRHCRPYIPTSRHSARAMCCSIRWTRPRPSSTRTRRSCKSSTRS